LIYRKTKLVVIPRIKMQRILSRRFYKHDSTFPVEVEKSPMFYDRYILDWMSRPQFRKMYNAGTHYNLQPFIYVSSDRLPLCCDRGYCSRVGDFHREIDKLHTCYSLFMKPGKFKVYGLNETSKSADSILVRGWISNETNDLNVLILMEGINTTANKDYDTYVRAIKNTSWRPSVSFFDEDPHHLDEVLTINEENIWNSKTSICYEDPRV
jgi:hypothetical protein